VGGNHLNPLHQLVEVGEKKIQVEAAGSIQKSDSLFEVAAFVSIGSSLFSLREIQQEFGGSRCLSHQFLLLRLSSSL
jgi:hypothetical protein